MKQNKYAHLSTPQVTIDLHGKELFVEQDLIHYLSQELLRLQQQKTEKVLIVTGKGLHSVNGVAKLRPWVEHFLRSSALVRRWNEARRDRGGSGAFEIDLHI